MKNNIIFLTFIISAITTSYSMEQPPTNKQTSQINPLFSTHNQYEIFHCPLLQPLANTQWLSKLHKKCKTTENCDDLYVWLNETIHDNNNITIPIVNQLLEKLSETRTKIEQFYEEKRTSNPKDLCAYHRRKILETISKLSKNNTTLQRPESAPSSDQKTVKKRSNRRKKSKRK